LLGGLLFAVWVYPPAPALWQRLDFNGAPFEDFIGPYFEMAQALPGATTPVPGYQYPAFFALLLWPLAQLGPRGASHAWLALELAATAWLFVLPLWLAPARRYAELAAYGALAGTALPIVHNLYWGQVSVPLAAALLTALALGMGRRASRRGRLLEGTLIGCATAIKLTPALFALGAWMRGERRVAVIAGVTAVALVVLPALLVLGPADAWAFHVEVCERLSGLARRVVDVEQGRGSQDLGAASARWWGAWCGPLPAFVVGRAFGLALALGLLLRLREIHEPGLAFAHLVLLAPLCVAPTWPHGLAGLPAAAWFVWRAEGSGSVARGAAFVAGGLASLPVHALFANPESYARSGVLTVAVLVLAAGLLLKGEARGAEANGGA